MKDYHPEYLMTPFNPLGYQMVPSKEATERSVRELCKKIKIVAINVLASGAVTLEQAIAYLTEHKENRYAVTSASVNPSRIFCNFCEFSRIFSRDSL
jgi:hypothetical protein